MSEVYKQHAQMVDDLTKPGIAIVKDMSNIGAERLHMAVGIMGEVAELIEGFYPPMGGKVDYENIREELGDIEFYYEGICQAYGIERVQVSAALVNALNLGNSIKRLIPNNTQLHMRLVSSAGNILDLVKKEVIYNKDIDRELLRECLLVMRVHLTQLYQSLEAMGINETTAREANLDKLLTGKNARYKDGSYSNEASIARADKG